MEFNVGDTVQVIGGWGYDKDSSNDLTGVVSLLLEKTLSVNYVVHFPTAIVLGSGLNRFTDACYAEDELKILARVIDYEPTIPQFRID